MDIIDKVFAIALLALCGSLLLISAGLFAMAMKL